MDLAVAANASTVGLGEAQPAIGCIKILISVYRVTVAKSPLELHGTYSNFQGALTCLSTSVSSAILFFSPGKKPETAPMEAR